MGAQGLTEQRNETRHEIWSYIGPFITGSLLLDLHGSTSLILYPAQTDAGDILCSLQ